MGAALHPLTFILSPSQRGEENVLRLSDSLLGAAAPWLGRLIVEEIDRASHSTKTVPPEETGRSPPRELLDFSALLRYGLSSPKQGYRVSAGAHRSS
jgi:hypothetical protein